MSEPLGKLEFPRGKGMDRETEVLRLSVDEYNDALYVSVRVWYRVAGGDYRPTKSGITIRARELHEAARWLTQAAEEIGIDPPEPRGSKRPKGPASAMGAGPELTPEEEAGLF